jgi:hypothetical protein
MLMTHFKCYGILIIYHHIGSSRDKSINLNKWTVGAFIEKLRKKTKDYHTCVPPPVEPWSWLTVDRTLVRLFLSNGCNDCDTIFKTNENRVEQNFSFCMFLLFMNMMNCIIWCYLSVGHLFSNTMS